MIGRTLGHYKIIEKIGSGGMGVVYRAHDSVLDRDVALKVMPEELSSSPSRRARFEREAKAVAALSHPNILEIHDFGSEGSTVFAVTELLEGESLRNLIDRERMSRPQAVHCALQVARGVSAAHKRGIIHRDLKPANIFVTGDGHVKILDFGIAKILSDQKASMDESAATSVSTAPGVVMGTVGYMSPEQVRGDAADSRSDIFAFGALLYELLVGRRAFARRTPVETMNAILKEEPPETLSAWKELPPALRQIIQRCLNKSPGDRFQSVVDVADAIEAIPGLQGDMRRGYSVEGRDADGVAPRENSIAVLPFTNMSPDPANEYLSDGLTEEIINALAQVRGISVASRTSSLFFKGKTQDIREVGEKLGVANVLEGSLRREGNRVRVTAQLVSTSDGYHIWSSSVDRDAEDLFAIQDEIATAIAGKLRAALGEEAKESLVTRPTDNPEAYDLYLKGRFHLEQRGEGLQRGLEFFQKALALDESFVSAHAGAAEAYAVMGFFGLIRPREAMPRAKAAARKALALDESFAAAHSALALVTMIYDWDWQASEAGLLRAIELDPKNTTARAWYGLYSLLCVRGKFTEAVEECKKAVEIDPVDTLPLTLLGTTLYTGRHYDEALPHLQKVVERSQNSYAGWRILGLIHLARYSHQEATAALTRAVELSGRNPWPLAELGIIHAASGRPGDAQALHDELAARSVKTWVPPVCRALLAMALGQIDEAFAQLDQAYRERDSLLIGFRQWPLLDPLRGDPRFDKLLASIGFDPLTLPESDMRREAAPRAKDSAVSRKMIVVLPFENLGPSEEDYFADGVVEEITSRLAEISDLGVISRTSAVQYDPTGKTIREIGQDLGAGYVLEGTVRWDQRSGSRVRITPQLIRVSDDTHLWSERYDRVLDDIFAVQSEIAENVIQHLEANLLDPDRAALTAKLTDNVDAYQAYLRGLSHTSEATIGEEDIRLAIKMFERAVELDPSFVQAYARLALDHSSMHVFGYDMTPERTVMAKLAADKAEMLAPGSYHAHVAQGYYFYRCEKDYDRALVEFEQAVSRRPNDATLRASMSYIQRRRGLWEESITQLGKSIELDPKNAVRLGQQGISLSWTRQYEQAELMFERSISLLPDQLDSYLERTVNLWLWTGCPERAAPLLASIPAQTDPRTVLTWYNQDIFSRDWSSALERVASTSSDWFIEQEGFYPKPFLEQACLVQMGEKRKADQAARAALTMLEDAERKNPTDPRIHCSMGLLHAAMGNRESAIRSGERAKEIAPAEKDVILGTTVLIVMAKILALVGESDVAMDEIEYLLSVPSELSPGMLRMDPAWDSLRENPRFKRLAGMT